VVVGEVDVVVDVVADPDGVDPEADPDGVDPEADPDGVGPGDPVADGVCVGDPVADGSGDPVAAGVSADSGRSRTRRSIWTATTCGSAWACPIMVAASCGPVDMRTVTCAPAADTRTALTRTR
jgi:hypothetical protein